jgi:hypothetical protein
MLKHSGRAALAIGFCALMTANASAATFVVDKNTDDTGVQACVTATPDDCSLRSAIANANADAVADAITLGAGTYEVTEAPQKQITQPVTLTGAGTQSTAIDGLGIQKPLLAVNTTDAVTVSDLTIRGAANAAFDYTVYVGNAAPLLLERIALVDNGSIPLQITDGTVLLSSSLVARNAAPGAGGIVNEGSSLLSIKNSTITQNTGLPTTPDQPFAYTGGIVSSGIAMIADSTIAGNRVAATADAIGGDNLLNLSLGPDPGVMRIRNSIVADPGFNGNCGRPIDSGGYNLDSDNTCGFHASSDHAGVDPLLSALADNGGPTDTRALPANSPAVDAGAGCAATDQRGVARPAASACDIGAFESPFTATVATPPAPPTTPADTTAPKLTVGGIGKTVKRKAFNKGLKVKIGGNEPIAAELMLLATPRKVTIAKLPSVALATRSLARAAGTRTVTLKPSTKVTGKRSVKMRLSVVAYDAAGNRSAKTVAFTVK